MNNSSLTTADIESFINQSRNGMIDQQQIHTQTWGLNGPSSSWDVDLEKGIITFTFPDKVVTANVQVIGTLHNGTFMWGWEHPSIPLPLQNDALTAKKWGEDNHLTEFTTHIVPATEEKAWDFTAVAARLSNATGTYSAMTGETRVFMTFGKITISLSKT